MAATKIVNMQTSKLLTLFNAKSQWKSCLTPLSNIRLYSKGKSSEKVAASEAADPNATTTGTAADQENKHADDLEVLTKEIVSLKEKNNELLDKYRRSLAESENLRNRLNKQIADAKIFGIQSFCKDLLEVADTLGHATQAVPQDQLNGSNPHLKNLYDGLTMTKASLMQVFKRHGLEQMNPINEKFNPNMHEALFQKVDTNVAPDTIVEVTKLGYKLHDRVIRPALVGVSKAS